MNFDATLEKFIGDLRTKGRSTATTVAYKKDISQFNQFLKSAGVEDYKKASLANLQDFLKNFEKQSYAPKSISRKINSLRTFFTFLKSQNLIADNVSTSITHPKLIIKAPRVLSAMEYRALRDVCHSDVRLFAVVELLLQTGMRIGELARVRVEDVKFSSGAAGGDGKISIPALEKELAREVAFNRAAQAALKAYLSTRNKDNAKTEVLFITKTGRPFLIRNIRSAINLAFRRAGIKSATVNDLRHTFAAYHLRRGFDPKKLHLVLGHRRASTTERYLDFIKVDKDAKTDELAEL